MFASLGHVLRLGRAGFILAREGVFSGVDAAGLPPKRGRLCCSPDWWRAGAAAWRDSRRPSPSSARPMSSSGKLWRPGPTWLASTWRASLKRCRTGWRRFRAMSRSASSKRLSGGPWPAFCRIQRAGGGGLRRAGASAPRWSRTELRGRSPSRCCDRASSGGSVAISATCFSPRAWPKNFPPRRSRLNPVGVVDTLARSVKIEMDFRLEAAGGIRIRRKHQWRRRFSGAQGRLGPLRPRSHDARMDRRRAFLRYRSLAPLERRICRASAAS